MRSSKFFTYTILTLLLLSGFAGVLMMPNSPVGTASAAAPIPGSDVSVCFGDSITYGYNIAAKYTYPDRMNVYIGNTVINKGIIGQKTADMLARYSTDVLAYTPKNIFILGGTNDITTGVGASVIESNLGAMVSQGDSANSEVFLLKIPPANSYNASQNDILASVNSWMDTLAGPDVHIVDIHAALKDPDTPTNMLPAYTSDGKHPNAAGAKVLADTVANVGVADSLWTLNRWVATGASNASVASSWSLGHAITTGERAIFDAASVVNCSFDVSSAIYSIGIAVDYSGTIIETADMNLGAGGYFQQAGVFTGATTKSMRCDGSWSKVGGTLTPMTLRLVMTGNNTVLSFPTTEYLHSLTVSGSCIVWGTNLFVPFATNVSGTMENQMSANFNVGYEANKQPTFINTGSIIGTKKLNIYLASYDLTATLGHISCPLEINSRSGSSGDRTLTLNGDAILADVTIRSEHATYTTKLDTNDRDLACVNLTIGVRGVLLGKSSTIESSGIWDSSAGTWTPEASTVELTGTGTVKTAAGQTFYNLTASSGSSITQASDVTVTNYMDPAGTWNKGAYTLAAPLPSINSTAPAYVNEDSPYTYGWTTNYSQTSTASVVTNATWLTTNFGSWTVTGVPSNGDVGSYYMNVTLTNAIGVVYQNSTIQVNNTALNWDSEPITEWTYSGTYLYDGQTNDEFDGVTYSFTHTGSMDWWIEPDSGILRCHVTDSQPVDISLIADDGHGSVIYQNFTVSFDMLAWDHEIIIVATEGQNNRVSFDFIVNESAQPNIERVQWNFGDGFGSKEASCSHKYEANGTYLITCYVRMADGTASSTTKEITVGDPVVVDEIDNRIAAQLQQAVLLVALVCLAGGLLSYGYVRLAGGRGRFNHMVLYLIVVAMLAISLVIIGDALIGGVTI